MSGPIL